MKRFRAPITLFLAFCFIFGGSAFAVEPLTLTEAHTLALKRSEDITIKKELIEEARGHFYQALDVLMPSVHFVMTQKEQDVSDSASTSSDSATSNLTRRSTPEKKFTFSQPLFSGFKEFAALAASGAEKSQRRFGKERAEQLLFVDVMESFYACLAAQKDVETLDGIKKALGDRIRELDERVGVGRSRPSEIESARAELKVAESDLLGAERDLRNTRELLEFYIGKPLADVRLVEDPDEKGQIPELSFYLAKVSNRPDVKAQKEADALAAHNVTSARSGLFPKVKLDGNYYTERVGVQSDIDWDATLTIDVPIFEGTRVFGDIKTAGAQRAQAAQEFSKVRRQAELDIRSAYENRRFSALRAAALAEASAAMKKNYELQAADYRTSLVNNLDVLDALRRAADIERQYHAAHYEAKRDAWKLKIAAGETPQHVVSAVEP